VARGRSRRLLGAAGALLAAGVAVGALAATGELSSAASAPSCVPPRMNVSAALAGRRVTVSPQPESRDASAETQISMLGVPARELADVTVTGSRTGRHAGRLEAYSQGDGASFLPDRPFADGERVRVRAQLREGARSVPFAWSFTVAVRDVPGAHSSAVGTFKRKAAPKPPPPSQYQSYRSAPSLRPPAITVSSSARDATADLFLAPYMGNGQYGPMILGAHGELVWFEPLHPAGTRAGDFRVQRYEGKRVLTWWQDPLVTGSVHSAGVVIADSSYRTIHVVRAGNGYQPDLHEFTIEPHDTAVITVYDAIECNLSAVGGPRDGAVADTLLQELDLKTGLVRYEWHSLDHVPLRYTYLTAAPSSLAQPFDYFHINSVDRQRDGDLLVDSRDTWAAYDVDARTGQVRWQLGGQRSSFKLEPGAATAWQHDALAQAGGRITFFDNGASPKEHSQSRAIEVALDRRAMTARLVREYEHSPPLVADSQGNVQTLANGDWVVGWGEAGYLSEQTPAGEVLFDAHLPSGWESYRTFAEPWRGRPDSPPALAAQAGADGGATAYASWNGATEVASWRALAGPSPAALAAGAPVAKSGFETAIALPGLAAGAYVRVQALDAAGAVIGSSRVVRVRG